MPNTSNFTDIPDVSARLNVNINMTIWTILLSAITSLANLGTIVAFVKVKSLREKPSNLLILSLAVVDFFQGLIVIPYNMSNFVFGRWIFGEVGCKLYVAMGYQTVVIGLYTLCLISLDRLLLVKLPYPTYMKHVQRKPRILLVIIACWVVSFLPVCIDLVFWDKAKSLSDVAARINFDYECLAPTRWIPEISSAFLLMFLFTPVFLVAVFSLTFLYALHLRLKKMRRVGIEDVNLSNSTEQGRRIPNDQEEQSKNRYLKPAMTLGALVAAMCISILPYVSYVVVIYLCPTCLNPQLVYCFVILGYCNALFDAVLYGITESKLRRFYASCLKRLTNRW